MVLSFDISIRSSVLILFLSGKAITGLWVYKKVSSVHTHSLSNSYNYTFQLFSAKWFWITDCQVRIKLFLESHKFWKQFDSRIITKNDGFFYCRKDEDGVLNFRKFSSYQLMKQYYLQKVWKKECKQTLPPRKSNQRINIFQSIVNLPLL